MEERQSAIEWADLVAVSTSGGIDSMLSGIKAIQAARAAGVPVVFIHADMGKLEHGSAADAGVAVPEGFDGRTPGDLAKAQADHYGAPFYVVRRTNGDLMQQVREKGVFPRVGMKTCQGTSDHKRGPIWTVFTRLANEWLAANPDAGRTVRILDVQGLASHESHKRASRLEKLEIADEGGRWEPNKKASNKTRRTVRTWFPLADMKKDDIWTQVREECAATGAPEPCWTYGVGLPRLSCSICVFASRDALVLSGKYNRAVLAEYVAIEVEIDVQWRKEFSLAEVLADVDAGIEIEPNNVAYDDAA